MNWGARIYLSIILFVAGMVFLAYVSISNNIDLVTDNYYEKDLEVQGNIESMTRALELEDKLRILDKPGQLLFKFPTEMDGEQISGVIKFYRPSDASLDRKYDIQLTQENEQSLDKNLLQKGYWRITVDWVYNRLTYKVTNDVIIQ